MAVPALFVSHGAPTVALEEDAYTQALRAHGTALAPTAVVAVSAHWEERGNPRLTVSPRPSTLHDFSGFPEELYRISYPAPGAPALAEEIGRFLGRKRIDCIPDPHRGLDHGVWVPLRLIFPEPRVPVVALSLPVPREPCELLALGAALAPLRQRGVLLLGSGGVVHNLRQLHWGEKEGPAQPWARAFDQWVAARVTSKDVESLLCYREMAPHPELAVPTTEHFDPLFFVMGAASENDTPRSIFEGFHYGTLSMRCFAMG